MTVVSATFTGSIYDMLAECWASVPMHVSRELWELGREYAVWMTYNGPDCAPFQAYVRFRKNSIVLANVFGIGTSKDDTIIRKGRMPHILTALSMIHNHVIVESVVNKDLADYLLANGFKRDGELVGTFYRDYQDSGSG